MGQDIAWKHLRLFHIPDHLRKAALYISQAPQVREQPSDTFIGGVNSLWLLRMPLPRERGGKVLLPAIEMVFANLVRAYDIATVLKPSQKWLNAVFVLRNGCGAQLKSASPCKIIL